MRCRTFSAFSASLTLLSFSSKLIIFFFDSPAPKTRLISTGFPDSGLGLAGEGLIPAINILLELCSLIIPVNCSQENLACSYICLKFIPFMPGAICYTTVAVMIQKTRENRIDRVLGSGILVINLEMWENGYQLVTNLYVEDWDRLSCFFVLFCKP